MECEREIEIWVVYSNWYQSSQNIRRHYDTIVVINIIGIRCTLDSNINRFYSSGNKVSNIRKVSNVTQFSTSHQVGSNKFHIQLTL